MRLFTKKALITFIGLFLTLAVVSCGGSKTTEEESPNGTIPKISNPDAVFYSTDDYQITYGDLYNSIKLNNGMSQLLNMVDEQLFATYINKVTSQEIADKIKKLTYGTTDDTEIAKLTDDEKAQKIKQFNDNMTLLGYENGQNSYIRLVCAEENYAKDVMQDPANSAKSWYVGPSTIAQYYQTTYFNDISSIRIGFSSEDKAKDMLESYNLVSLGGVLKLYTGDTPLSQVPSSSLNDTNTRDLTNQELLNKFVAMYNDVYGVYKDKLPANPQVADLLNIDDLKTSYDDMSNANKSIAKLIFSLLGNYQDYVSGVNNVPYYTYKPVSYAMNGTTRYYLIMNLSSNTKADVSNFKGTESDLVSLIGRDTYDKIKTDMINANIVAPQFVTTRVAEYRASKNFQIFDYYIGLDYSQVYSSYVQSGDGDKEILCSYDGKEITADQFLTYALNKDAPLYLIYAAQDKAVLNAHYEDVYCTDDTQTCDYDYINNTSDAMQSHIDAYNTLQSNFASSQYAQYYSFEDYMYLAYGAKNEQDMLGKYYVKSALQPLFIYDYISANNFSVLNTLTSYIDDYYNNYFDIGAYKLLVYVDRNDDGAADDYQTFYDSLTDKASFDTMLDNLKTAVINYMNDDSGNSFISLVKQYNDAGFDDPVWGVFKQNGIYLKQLNLNTTADTTYVNTVNNYDKDIVTELKSLYDLYQDPANIDNEFLMSQDYLQTSDGMNLFYITKGDNFEQPTFKFTDNPDDKYDKALENSSDQYTFDQLKLYAEYRFADITSNYADAETIYNYTKPVIPASLLTAFDSYFSDIYNGLYVVGTMNSVVADQLLAGTYDNEESSYCSFTFSDLKDKIQGIRQVYQDNVMKDFDH